MRKRLLSILMAAFLLLSCAPTAYAGGSGWVREESTSGGGSAGDGGWLRPSGGSSTDTDLAAPPILDSKAHSVNFASTLTGGVYSDTKHKTYLISKEAQKLWVYDHVTDAIEKETSLNESPDGIDLSKDGTHLYIVNDDNDILY